MQAGNRPIEATIIIPCLQERDHIAGCLENVLAFDYPKDRFEILVVDGMSTDGTRDILHAYAERDGRIQLIDNPEKIASVAMNRGIRRATGEFIVRIDVHTEYAPDYLRTCLKWARSTGADNTGGPARTKYRGYFQKANSAAFHSVFGVGGARFHKVGFQGYVDTVAYGCFRKSKLLEVGLYDETLTRNQDDELNFRLIRSGGKIWQSSDIKSWYYPRSRIGSLFRQYMQYGYWKVRVIRKHGRPASVRHLVPVSFVLFILCGGVLAIWLEWFRPLWLGVLGLYAFCSLAASVSSAWLNGWSILPMMPVIFFVYHFSYGFGFLLGVVDFLVFRGKKHNGFFNRLSR